MVKNNFDKYVDKRQGNLSAEAMVAKKVFSGAYTLSAALFEIRQLKSMSQLRLAELSGVQQGDISRIENGSKLPSMPTLFKLLDAMGVTVKFEIGNKPKRPRKSSIHIEKVSA